MIAHAKGAAMTRFPLAILVFIVAACGDSNSGSRDGGADMRAAPLTCVSDNQTFQLAGKYGVRATLEVNVKLPVGCTGASCIVNQDATAKLLLLTEVTQSNNTVSVIASPCRVQVPPIPLKGGNQPVILTIPDQLLTSVERVMSTATLDSTMTCASFASNPITITLGARLANAFSDPLPMATSLCGGVATTACSPTLSETGCVCDQESDGNLGATLNVMNAPGFSDIDLFFVDLRTSVSLAGKVFPPMANPATRDAPRIIGAVRDLKLDQNILGCRRNPPSPGTPKMCDSSEVSAVSAFNPVITQSANTESSFFALPVADDVTCSTLVSRETAVFD
jgi:hypothetical protein